MQTAANPDTDLDSTVFVWPHGAHVAVWMAPHLQFARVAGATVDDYGHRAGFWRLMDVFDKLGLRASVSLDARDAHSGADILQACVARDWELNACVVQLAGPSQVLQPHDLTLACETLRSYCGKPLAGWLAGAAPLDDASLERLAGAGLTYVSNSWGIDHPRILSSRAGPLVDLPYCEAASDQRCLVEQGLPARRYARLISDQFEQLFAEGATRPCVLGLPLHPAVIGLPQNLREFEAAMAGIGSRGKVWLATAREISEWVVQQHLADASAPPVQGGR